MTQFTIHAIQNTPATTQPLLEGARQRFGFVPNLLAGLAESPTTLQAYLELGALFEKTSLTPTERQVVLLAASAENHCTYCMAAHSMIAKQMVKVDTAIVEALRRQQPLADQKLEALAAFTRAVVKQRGEVNGKVFDNFITAGYSREQVLDVVLGVTMKTLSNYANHIMHTPLDTQFQTEAWDEPAQCNKHCTS